MEHRRGGEAVKGIASTESIKMHLWLKRSVYERIEQMSRDNQTDLGTYVREIVEDFVFERRSGKSSTMSGWTYSDRNADDETEYL